MVDPDERAQEKRPPDRAGSEASMRERILREQQLSGERQKQGRGWSELPTSKDIAKREGKAAEPAAGSESEPTPGAAQAEHRGQRRTEERR